MHLVDLSQYLKKIAFKRIHNVPLINLLLLSVLSSFLIRLTTKYHRLYTKSSLLATVATNLVLYGIADTLAQSISAFYASPIRLDEDQESMVSEELQNPFVDYGTSPSWTVSRPSLESKSQPFAFHRLAGFMVWGFVMAFVQVVWYAILNAMFNDDPTFVTVLERCLTDQLCFSPVSLFCFFAYSTLILEGATGDELSVKLREIYLSTLAFNMCVWFPVQFINFLVMPKNLQVPFSSSVGILWNCFLSMRNASSAAA